MGKEVKKDKHGKIYVTDDKPIFPKILTKREENTLEMHTFLRKKHYGKWYLWEFFRRAYVPEGQMDYSSAVSAFNRDIYMCMLYGKVNTKAVYNDGSKVFKLDDNQMDEKLRMRPLDYRKPDKEN